MVTGEPELAGAFGKEAGSFNVGGHAGKQNLQVELDIERRRSRFRDQHRCCYDRRR